MDCRTKYIKYKTKYIGLKNKIQYGGSEKNIFHVSGASGSGKTTLGNKLKERFGDKIVVKDIDDLRHEFIKEYYGDKEWDVIDKDAYQLFIDNFINKNKGEKPIVFVGLNNMPWWHRDLYYDMHSKHNFYIKLDNESIVKQKCIRFLTEELKDIVTDEIAMNDLIHNNKKFIKLISKSIDRECNASEIIADNDKWEKDYKNQGYKIISREDIYNEIARKIENIS